MMGIAKLFGSRKLEFWRCCTSVYLSVYVCLSASTYISGTTCAIFTTSLVHVAYGRGSIFLWWRG